MLYSEIKREVLSRINQYTRAGSPVAATYNNQADYLNRIATFFNSGLVNVRTTARRQTATVVLCEHETYFGGMHRYELPGDFYQLKTGGVSAVLGDRLVHTNDYRVSGRTHLLVPAHPDADYIVEYYRYPNLLPPDPSDEYELMEDIDVVKCAATYAAAQLMLYDDEFVYASLYNDYETQLNQLSNGVEAEVLPVQDAYSFDAGWF